MILESQPLRRAQIIALRFSMYILAILILAACYDIPSIGGDSNPRATRAAIQAAQAGHGARDTQLAEGAGLGDEPVGEPADARADFDLGPQPSDDMIVVPGLEEPLVRTRTTTPEEDAAVKRAVREFRRLSSKPSQIEDVIPPLEQFVADHPHSGWTAAVLLNLGLGYYRTGFFSRAFAAWETAWQDGRDAKEPRAKALVDRAVGELARMHARVGHADELEALFEDIGERPVTGPATELLTGAREGAWEMRNNPGNAFLCGPKALGNTLLALGAAREATAFTDNARSGRHGFTLAQVAQLADEGGMSYRLVYRRPGQEVPVPSVINWKVEHFASIVAEENGRYHIVDPTFGGDLLVSRAAIDAEASGYFLVPSGVHQDPGWRDATVEEALSVRGMGTTSTSKPGAVTGDDAKIGGDDGSGGISDGAGGTGGSGGRCGKSIGMCAPDAHAMAVSLNLTDTPVGYAPQRGPSAFVRFTFNQREDGQPAVIPFGNVSPKWTLNVLSYVQDDPPNPGMNVTRYVPGGGTRSYTGYNTSTGRFAPAMQTGEILERSPKTGPATAYTLTAPDGSQLIYSKSDNSGAMPRRMFLSTIKDPQGEAINLTYNSTYPSSPRLSAITDAGGRVTTFTYGIPECPLIISRITDPFGRYAQLAYHYQIGSSGSCTNLGTITDVVGISSQFDYDVNGIVDKLTTPYGDTLFTYSETRNSQSVLRRSLEIKDPMGFTECVVFRHDAPVPSYDQNMPQGLTNYLGMTVYNGLLQRRNTYYWDKHAFQSYNPGECSAEPGTKDYTKAKRWHWLHTANNQTSPVLESTAEPGESRVWYTYPDQQPLYEGSSAMPTGTARVLEGGAPQLSTATYNPVGRPLVVTDPLGRKTRYTYAANNIDLERIEQQTSTVISGGVGGTVTPVYSTVAVYTYNSKHQPLSMTDAAGKTWLYTYYDSTSWTPNRLRTITDPLGRMTVYTYDTLSRLKTIINANSATALTLGYLTSCETYNPTHLNCELPISATDSEGRTVTFVRDALDRIREVVYPDGTKDVDTYTNLDLTSSKDRLNRTTTYAYDLNRRLKSVTDPLNHVIKYDYYRNGELQKLTDENNKSTTWNLDAFGRLGSKTFADNTSITYTYDPTGKLKTTTDALGQVKTFGYHSDDMLASITYTNAANPTPNVAFAYDPWFPRLARMTDGIGTTQWTYVPLGTKGALSVQTEDGPFSNDSVTYAYEDLGRVSSMTVGNSPAETWHYDLIGRVDQHVTALGTFNFTYLGQTDSIRTRVLAGTSISSTWSYDSNTNDRRLTAITHSNGARSFSFGYQRFGGQTGINPYQITSINRTGGGLATQLNCYQYDDAGRLLNVGKPTGTPANCSQTQTSLYSFVPDPAGNLTTFTTASGTVSQTFPNSLNQIASSGARTFTFDLAGRERTDSWTGGGWNYKWDAEDRLVRVDAGPPPGNQQVATIRFDGLGRRLEVIHQAGSMSQDRFTWCGSEICARRKASDESILSRYFEEGHTYLSTKYIVMRDHLGSATSVLYAATGALIGTVDYTPYGEISAGASIAPDIAYAGLYLDRDLGKTLLSKTRAYDPGTGQWLSRDPIDELGSIAPVALGGVQEGPTGPPPPLPLGLDEVVGRSTSASVLPVGRPEHAYEYANGDPTNQLDPSGLDGEGFGQCGGRGGRKRRSPLQVCLDSCAQGGDSMENYCRKLRSPRARAGCWAARYASEVACKGWCYYEYGT